jgi:hypothetical protein
MKNIFILLLSIFAISNLAKAKDRIDAPEINWVKDAKVDFCSESNTFDFRNAYWLGALSYFSYWDIKYANPLIATEPEIPLDLQFDAPPASGKAQVYHGLGFGKLKSVFFSSAAVIPETASADENLVRKWEPPLPYEACVKPDKIFCFAGQGVPISTELGKRSQLEDDVCGEFNEKAYFEVARLRNIQNLVSGKKLSEKQTKQALSDKHYIENFVNRYEETKKVKLNLDWSKELTSKRCEIFKYRDSYMPDTQAGIFENDKMITIVVRGTEQGNASDIQTDLMTFNQVDLSKFSKGKGSIHRGFYKASVVLKEWLIKELARLKLTSPVRAQKPIYITGHSLGGAIANLITYTMLEYNNAAKEKSSIFNLKALYTFGAPRVGDYTWATRFHELAEKMSVGLYRMVNYSDLVPNVPCLNYTHAGSLIYMDPSKLSEVSSAVKVLLNPIDKIFNLGGSHINIANCGYETILHYPLYLKEMVKNHFMTSYHDSLSALRDSFNEKIEKQKQEALNNADLAYAQELTYPHNCQKPKSGDLNLEGIELNYQLLKNNLED